MLYLGIKAIESAGYCGSRDICVKHIVSFAEVLLRILSKLSIDLVLGEIVPTYHIEVSRGMAIQTGQTQYEVRGMDLGRSWRDLGHWTGTCGGSAPSRTHPFPFGRASFPDFAETLLTSLALY
jgi:hypothetical protein